jgi:hypothetical protein
MAWPFRCDSPDFHVRSIPDDTAFAVKRSCLVEGSELFSGSTQRSACMRAWLNVCITGNMFADCDDQEPIVDLPESGASLSVLFRLLHDPPKPFFRIRVEPGLRPPEVPPGHETDVEHAIPFVIMPLALGLADKYMLAPAIVENLHTHIGAHVASDPLPVYGLALSLGLQYIANSASEYLMDPPLAQYTPAEISVIPTVKDLHQLVRLHHAREMKLCEVCFAR